MKTIKPQRLGVLTRAFEAGAQAPQCHLGITLIAFFPFDAPGALLPEVSLWKFLAQELGKNAALDAGMPKARGELLVTGKGYPPGSAPVITCNVRVKLGPVDKSLHVIGDRTWRAGGMVSAPAPFRELAVSWENAYGGEGYSMNPLGKGAAQVVQEGKRVHPLPNIEEPGRRVSSPGDAPPRPAGFGPYELTWPQRYAKVGTYDQRWLEERFPGLAADIDWTFFNTAPEDQQIDGYFTGDEPFRIENMHPSQAVLEGALPKLATGAFITVRAGGADTFREVPTRLDTIWLFPHAERGVLLFRGVTPVAEDDGSDVLHLLAAVEDLGSPRPVAHYEAVLQQRLDKERGHLYALRDADLMPPGRPPGPPPTVEESDKLLATEGLAMKNLRRKAELEREAARERIRALGLDPDELGPPPLPPEEPPPSLDAVDAFLEKVDAMNAQAKADAEARKAEAEAERRRIAEEHGLDYEKALASSGTGPPRFSAEAEMAKLRALQREMPSPELDALLADPALPARLQSAERQLMEVYRMSVHYQPPAARLGAASRPARMFVETARSRGESLAGRDFTGSDFSGMALGGADLRGALLESVDLTGADLSGADLSGAILAHATLAGARLEGAKLVGANLGSATLSGARLERADLSGATLVKANCSGATLTGATLTGADLSEAVLAGADLSGAVAPELTFLKSDLSGVRFSGADLTKALFLEVPVAGADFSGAKLESAAFLLAKGEKAVFREARAANLRFVKDCAFPGADFRGAGLEGANLRGTDLSRADFQQARLGGADLSECNLRGGNLYRVTARGARFVKTDFTEASLVSANLMEAILQKATLERADLSGANLFRADLARFKGAPRSVQDANLTQVRTVPPRG